jgi:hypothetical protein
MDVKFQLKLSGKYLNNCHKDHNEIIGANMANLALVTMGRDHTHCEAWVENGQVMINHTFTPITNTYEDELDLSSVKATNAMISAGLNYNREQVISDHIIIWLYRVRNDLGTSRTYLIGAVAVNTLSLLKASDTDAEARAGFIVRHNFVEASIHCEVQKWTGAGNNSETIKYLTDTKTAYDTADMKLRMFDEKNGLRKKMSKAEKVSVDIFTESNSIDEGFLKSPLTLTKDLQENRVLLLEKIRMLKFRPSPLKNLAEINELVLLEQTVVREKMVKECNKGKLGLCDPMGIAFLVIPRKP